MLESFGNLRRSKKYLLKFLCICNTILRCCCEFYFLLFSADSLLSNFENTITEMKSSDGKYYQSRCFEIECLKNSGNTLTNFINFNV